MTHFFSFVLSFIRPLYTIVIISTIFILSIPVYHNNRNYLVVIVIIDYSPLWQTMKSKNITQYRLLKSGIDNKTLDSLKKNGNITLLTLEKLCRILECTPNDIVKFTDKE